MGSLSNLLLLGSALLIFISFLFFLLFLTQAMYKKPAFLSRSLWKYWRDSVEREEDDHWKYLLQKAGYPLKWGKAEWVAIQCFCGLAVFTLLSMGRLAFGVESISFLVICLVSCVGFFIPLFILKWWANYREDMLSVDIARFTNRFIALLENNVPTYSAMVKAARPTRQLKHYIPTLPEWNKDKIAALERLKRELGVEDAIILVSNMRTLEQMPVSLSTNTMLRLESSVDNRRLFRHRKKIKSLGMAYSLTVYPAFYIGLIVAMFPWYKVLGEILHKYLI
ncbi:hypothetical protein [Brevibacillus daliensis]|uniref:hypothetical protein n=1 Tax=Brevibacillus daliensis TaxID=2892995 RepID=UPI001E63D1FD|nr:hypothetical protein [Brevibacillus daliensis]